MKMKLTFYRGLDMREFLSSDEEVIANNKDTCYDLIANISHDGEPGIVLFCFVSDCYFMFYIFVKLF